MSRSYPRPNTIKVFRSQICSTQIAEQGDRSAPEGAAVDFPLQNTTYRLLQQHLQFDLSYACQHLWLWSCAGRSSPGATTLEPMPTHMDPA